MNRATKKRVGWASRRGFTNAEIAAYNGISEREVEKILAEPAETPDQIFKRFFKKMDKLGTVTKKKRESTAEKKGPKRHARTGPRIDLTISKDPTLDYWLSR